jgi:hypothetical protein
MAFKVYINVGTEDLAFGETGAEYVEMNLTADRLIFSAGSDVVKDTFPIPTPQQLNSAGILIGTADVEVPHLFLADAGEFGSLKEIHLAGNNENRFVFCVAFDAGTNSEPILELWDNLDLNSIDLYSLGSGVANKSFFRGKRTTDGLPGTPTDRLAGSSETHFLWLKNGKGLGLTGAEDLYFNLRITVPPTATAAGEIPIIAIKYT